MNEHDQEIVLRSLRPTTDQKVMDLVSEAGVDVAPWAIKKDGTPVANPKANPNYCFDWAFGGIGEPIVLCVWYESLVSCGEGLSYEGNMRAMAARLEDLGLDRNATPTVRSRAKKQARRCDRFDQRIQIAFRKSLPVRVILLQGEMADELGHDASKVEFRRLDDLEWWAHLYDDATGCYRLIRGVAPVHQSETISTESSENDYVDQFSVPDVGERRQRIADAFVRSAEVRRQVLRRAGGLCERCGQPGFVTASGGTYLETHHVIPLCEEGADAVSNVVALCPDDHRRAHYAVDRAGIREQLLAHLIDVCQVAATS